MLRKIFADTFQREQQSLKDHPPKDGFDLKAAVILGWSALGLTIIRYYGEPLFFAGVLGSWHCAGAANAVRGWAAESPLHGLEWWVGVMLLVYFFIPVLLVKYLFREKLSDYGLHFRQAFRDWWLYVLMLAVMLPLVFYFSSTQSFLHRYPFYDPVPGEKLWPDFWIWESLYFAQFIGLEFFFRGFITLGLKHRFGFYSIFIMTVPYCMIHFGKPMPETIGAVFAGIILGTLSMKSRSIFMGVLIHYSIAISMDLFALWRKGFF